MPAIAPDCLGILIIKYLTTIHKDISFYNLWALKKFNMIFNILLANRTGKLYFRVLIGQ
jgi:hypothetical protein